MPQRPLTAILARRLAELLAQGLLLVDAEGRVLFWNEPGEALIGRTWADAAPVSVGDLVDIMGLVGEAGGAVSADELPLSTALAEGRTCHRSFAQRDGGMARRIAMTAFPLDAPDGRRQGAIAVLWDEPGE